jgi:hypothetical protein
MASLASTATLPSQLGHAKMVPLTGYHSQRLCSRGGGDWHCYWSDAPIVAVVEAGVGIQSEPCKVGEWVGVGLGSGVGEIVRAFGASMEYPSPTGDADCSLFHLGRVPSSEFRVPSSEFRVPSSEFRVPSSEYRVPITECD